MKQDSVITEKLDNIMRLLQLNNDMQMDRFMYTEGKITRKHDPEAKLFSKKVKNAYGALEHGQCWCLLTNALLPSSTVIAFHLFKWEWAECVYLLGFEDINDTRNGLPSWKPLEWAFDSSRLCFTYNKYTNQFIANVLDPNILLQRPFKRALNFQARQARKYAIRHNWKPLSWDFEDYLTEGLDMSQKIALWFESMQ